MRNALGFVALVGLAAPLLACGAAKKVTECNAVIEKINAAQQEAEKLKPSAETTPQDVKKVAELFEKLSTDLRAMELSTAELKGFVTEYQGMSDKAAAAARKLAAAVEQKDLAKVEAATKDMNAATAPEDALVQKINGFCSGGS
jgi:septal ring factor EnvC (AmiA/AmiB activator)